MLVTSLVQPPVQPPVKPPAARSKRAATRPCRLSALVTATCDPQARGYCISWDGERGKYLVLLVGATKLMRVIPSALRRAPDTPSATTEPAKPSIAQRTKSAAAEQLSPLTRAGAPSSEPMHPSLGLLASLAPVVDERLVADPTKTGGFRIESRIVRPIE